VTGNETLAHGLESAITPIRTRWGGTLSYSLPNPSQTLEVSMPDGAVIEVRVRGNRDGPRLMLSHGNGFAIDAYFPFWRHLSDRYELVMYDQRNHGRNPYHGAPGHTIEGFVDDLDRVLAAIGNELGAKPTAGIYHSVSAIAAVAHAVERGWPWDALVLFDPPLIPTPGHPLHELAQGFELLLANWAMARPDRFDDPDELAEIYRTGRAQRRWVDGAPALMARAQLREDPDSGGWRLSCERELEAAIYIANAFSRVWDRIGRLKAHADDLLLICSDPELGSAKSPAFIGLRLAEEFGFRHQAIQDTTHLLQIERPEACAEAASRFLAERNFV
jgi:pimeloyl-ACP methyl ester carboxylesterase